MSAIADIPVGLCQCGCGERTTQLKHDDPTRGMKAGEHCRFVHNHWHRLKRMTTPEWGKQSQRLKLLNELRPLAGKMDLRHRFSCPEAASRFINFNNYSHFTHALCEDPATVLERMRETSRREAVERQRIMREKGIETPDDFYPKKPKPKPVVPYERKEIEYERETELQMLVNLPHATSLDQPVDEGHSFHERLSGSNMTPLEALIWKEEQEEQEREDRISEYARRIANTVKQKEIPEEVHRLTYQFSGGYK